DQASGREGGAREAREDRQGRAQAVARLQRVCLPRRRLWRPPSEGPRAWGGPAAGMCGKAKAVRDVASTFRPTHGLLRAEFLAHLLAQIERALAFQLGFLVIGLERQYAIPFADGFIEILPLERLRGFALVTPRQRLPHAVTLRCGVLVAGVAERGFAKSVVGALEI